MTTTILKRLEPSSVTLEGRRLPLFFTMRAAALMEEALGMDYPTIINRLFELEGAPPLKVQDQALVVVCLVQEGQRAMGEPQLDVEELLKLLDGLHMEAFTDLARVASREVLFKSRMEQAGKNG